MDSGNTWETIRSRSGKTISSPTFKFLITSCHVSCVPFWPQWRPKAQHFASEGKMEYQDWVGLMHFWSELGPGLFNEWQSGSSVHVILKIRVQPIEIKIWHKAVAGTTGPCRGSRTCTWMIADSRWISDCTPWKCSRCHNLRSQRTVRVTNMSRIM